MPGTITSGNHANAAQANPNDIPVFDVGALIERCMDDAAAAFHLLQLFCDRLPGTVSDIDGSLASSDIPSALRTVHILVGNAGNLGAGRLHQAGLTLECALRHGDFAETPAQLSHLQQEADRFVKVVASYPQSFI